MQTKQNKKWTVVIKQDMLEFVYLNFVFNQTNLLSLAANKDEHDKIKIIVFYFELWLLKSDSYAKWYTKQIQALIFFPWFSFGLIKRIIYAVFYTQTHEHTGVRVCARARVMHCILFFC